jgi:hypothetical protein
MVTRDMGHLYLFARRRASPIHLRARLGERAASGLVTDRAPACQRVTCCMESSPRLDGACGAPWLKFDEARSRMMDP